MTLPVEEMPLQTAEQITLYAEERRQTAAEVRGSDIRGHVINTLVADVQTGTPTASTWWILAGWAGPRA